MTALNEGEESEWGRAEEKRNMDVLWRVAFSNVTRQMNRWTTKKTIPETFHKQWAPFFSYSLHSVSQRTPLYLSAFSLSSSLILLSNKFYTSTLKDPWSRVSLCLFLWITGLLYMLVMCIEVRFPSISLEGFSESQLRKRLYYFYCCCISVALFYCASK